MDRTIYSIYLAKDGLFFSVVGIGLLFRGDEVGPSLPGRRIWAHDESGDPYWVKGRAGFRGPTRTPLASALQS